MTRLASCAVAALVAAGAPRGRVRRRRRDAMADVDRSCSTPARRASSSRCSTPRGDGLAAAAARPDRGPVHVAAVRRQGRATAPSIGEKSWGDGHEARARGRARPPGRLPARARRRAIAWWPSATASCTAAPSTRGRCGSTPQVIDALEKLMPLAPLHQPHNLAPIRILAKRRPELPQVACFDTAFHRAQPEVAQAFALPRRDHRPRACVATASTACRTSTSPACCRSSTRGPRRARPSSLHLGNGAQHVRAGGRAQRGEHDGLHRGRRAADGHALRQPRPRRDPVPDGRARHGRARDREPDLPAVGAARRVGHLERHAHAAGQRRPAREGLAIDLYRLPHRARAGLARRGAAAGSTRSCSPPASASTRR